jgi:hypothetical protein
MSTLKLDTLLAADGTQTTEPSIPALDQRMAKAWCVYKGNTNTLSTSYNVSSVTDVATGKFTVNYLVALSNADHPTVSSGPAASSLARNLAVGAKSVTTSTAEIDVETSDGDAYDIYWLSFIAFDN